MLAAGVSSVPPLVVRADAPERGDAAIDRAVRDFEAGRYQDAVAVLKDASTLDTDPGALFWLGRAEFELHEYPAAIQALERSIALAPDDSEAHRWLGRAYGEEADRRRSWSLARKVRQHFETAVRLAARSVAAHRDLLQFYLDAPWVLGGTDDNARRQVTEITQLDPIAGRLARATYASHHGNVSGAAAEYRAVIAAQPATAAAYFEAADFFEGQRDPDGLRVAIDGAATVAHDDRRLSYYRAALDIMSGDDLSRAGSLMHTYLAAPACSEWPSFASAHQWLGLWHERQGRVADAVAEYRAALALDPGRKSAIASLKRLGAQ